MTSPATNVGAVTSAAPLPPAEPAGSTPPDVARTDWLAEYPPVRSLPLDQEALRIYEHAYAIGLKVEREEDPPVTFSTVLAAVLAGEDQTSRWFAATARGAGPDATAVFAEKGIDATTVAMLRPAAGRPKVLRLSKEKHLLTVSARSALENAEAWAQRVGGTDIGVRHLVASYVLNPPPAHRSQMLAWKYQEAAWRSAYFDWVSKRYTAERWLDASERPAPSRAIREFEHLAVKGDALAFPGDAGTLTVLERAAALHAGHVEPGFSLKWLTVFFALIDTAREDAAVRQAIQPLFDAVRASDPRYQQVHDGFIGRFLSRPAPAGGPAPFAELDVSPRVLNVLESARALAAATRRPGAGELHVGALHFAGALVSRRVDADDDLASVGLRPDDVRSSLIRHAENGGEPGDAWKEALGQEADVFAGWPTELNSDDPEAVVRLDESWASDPLAIRRDVETFAALLASRALDPPLSIGLFGPWGSGKTTFLKRLRRAVDRRTKEAEEAWAAARREANRGRQPPAPPQYVFEVVHVEFNAWHFSEGALISSLVDTIFRALSDHIQERGPRAGEAWREQAQRALVSTLRRREAAEAHVLAARAAVQKAETSAAEARRRAADAATNARGVLQALWATTKRELKNSDEVRKSGVLEALGDAVASGEELRDRIQALRARPARLLGELGWPRSLLFAGLVLVLPPLGAWITGEIMEGQRAVALLTSATATLSTVGLWARAATGAASRVDEALAQVADEYARRIAADPDVVEAGKALDVAQAGAATAAAELEAARQEAARAQTEAANAALPAQMLRLVSSRIDADTYGKELTTLSLARADLEELSRLLRGQRGGAPADEAAVPEGAARTRAVERVILYIDDLDRCKPEDVVRVLQVVHMLLAFELFVVVVAVDAHWVEEALAQSYRWLADDGAAQGVAVAIRAPGRVTPQDYLEKIFQISFWLEPMTAARAASYVGSLVRVPASESWLGHYQGGSMQRITSIELDYLRALAAHVGSSPRRVKRLVNAYRLIKAGMPSSQLGSFVDRTADDGQVIPGPYQLVIGLLVIGMGAPSCSAQIVAEIAESDPTDALERVVERLRGRNHPEWTMAAQVVETLMRTQKAENVSELRGWARKVGRFLLHRPSEDRAVRLAAAR